LPCLVLLQVITTQNCQIRHFFPKPSHIVQWHLSAVSCLCCQGIRAIQNKEYGDTRIFGIEQLRKSHLRIVKSNKRETVDFEQLINAAWGFAYGALWNNCVLSDKEVKVAKANIQLLSVSSRDYEKAFIEFVQRVVLAQEHILSVNDRYIPVPSIWLDANNERGFVVTMNWLREVEDTRFSLPLHKVGT
jgi:hypothetical protein